MHRILFIFVLILVPNTAIGLTFSAPLADLVGGNFPVTGGRAASFNFGQQFSEITSVSIEIEAQVFAQEFDVCGTTFNPQPCVHEVHLLGFVALLDTEDHPLFSVQSSRGLVFDALDALEGYGVAAALFDDQFIQSNFEYLLDGRGSLTVHWNSVLGNPDRIIRNVTFQSGEIFSARLIIEGTPIPEPSTALLLATGLLALAGLKERSIS